MACFSIVTLQPEGYGHVGAFADIKLLLYYSLRDLGHEVSLATNYFPEGATPIVFGAHLITADFPVELPADSLLFNTEQLALEVSPWTQQVLALAARHIVLDYSSFNVALIRESVASSVVHRVRLGYHQELQRIDRSKGASEGFLFYGSITPLREQILARIRLSERLEIAAYFGVYGWQRDGLLRRCRGVLNIHSTKARILEWVRIVPLLANAVPCLALLSPESRWDDDQVSYLLSVPEDDPTPALQSYYESPHSLAEHASLMQQRLIQEEDQVSFTQDVLDRALSSGFVPSPGPQNSPPWRIPSAFRNPDEQWYRHTYYWVCDPRTPAEFHLQEGCFRQYHPDDSFKNSFKPPLALPGSTRLESKSASSLRIAVVLHFHREHKARLFFAAFGCWLASSADFYVTSTNRLTTAALLSLAHDYSIENFLVREIDNRGRDIPSKYVVFREALLGYDLCLFSHGKESDLCWFHDHNEILAGSPERIADIVNLFAGNPDLGLVFPDYLPGLIPLIGWGSMRRQIDALLRPHGWDTTGVDILEFPAGGFFWARPAALSSICELQLALVDLPAEPLARDNTLLHAIERLPCLSCERAGFRWERISRQSVQGPGRGSLALGAPKAASVSLAGAEHSLEADAPRVASASGSPLSVSQPDVEDPWPDLNALSAAWAEDRESFSLLHFHHYDTTGYLPLGWRELLQAMAQQGVRILISTCSGFDQEALEFVERNKFLAVRRPNRGRCLAAYRDTAILANELLASGASLEHLILLNDSILPLRDSVDCVDNLRQLIAGAKADVPALSGFTDSYERGHHLQSFCLVANAALIRDVAWPLFWSSLCRELDLDKHDLVGLVEVGLSEAMVSVGVELRALYPLLDRLMLCEGSSDELSAYPRMNLDALNPSLYLDRTLRREGWCFVKKMRLFDQPFSLATIQSILTELPTAQRERFCADLSGLLRGRQAA